METATELVVPNLRLLPEPPQPSSRAVSSAGTCNIIIVYIVFNLRILRLLRGGLLPGPAAAAHQTPADAPVTPRLTPEEASRCSGRHLDHRSSIRHHDSEGLRVDVRKQQQEEEQEQEDTP
ncbi:hypothetical protein CRUP_023024 [Coryphaenoides rupestris]|nr:hypothetical protein CRUP_023024 [Coryphaenoides rupestris]